jgi:hypothetical protein
MGGSFTPSMKSQFHPMVSIGSHWARVIHPPAHYPFTGCLNLNLSRARSIRCQLGNNCHRYRNSQIKKFLNLPGPPPSTKHITVESVCLSGQCLETAWTDRQIDTTVTLIYKICGNVEKEKKKKKKKSKEKRFVKENRIKFGIFRYIIICNMEFSKLINYSIDMCWSYTMYYMSQI